MENDWSKKHCFIFLWICPMLLFIGFNISAQTPKKIGEKVDSVLGLMTLDEKVGQLNQYSGDLNATGPITPDGDKQNQIRNGMVGSMLNVTGVERTRTWQGIAMQSRLKIPLLFGQDIIHGYRTTFPIPLAEASSWDLLAIELSDRIAATESAAAGIHWVFAPMVDIARDPRWGRVMEGAGEDPYLGSLIASARVRGFQGKGLGQVDAVMACAKHFAAYGAVIGGRDYNTVDMSLLQLQEIYLRPFKAASDAGVATFMDAFNTLNGIPATGNKYLQRDILKGDWGFKGFVVSDWGSVGEMVNHGNVTDSSSAAQLAIIAGCDMDMESRCYKNNLSVLVRNGKVPIALINDAVSRILRKKFEMGLFNNPFRYADLKREKEQWDNKENLKAAEIMAEKCIVLLKNEKNILPLSKETKSIALIGPFMMSKRELLGSWSYEWPDDSFRISSIYDAVKNKLNPKSKLYYAMGCGIRDTSKAGFKEATAMANKAEIIIISVGEARDMTGEAKSRSNLGLPGVQEELIKALVATGKPVIVLISAGRPLIFNWTANHVPSLLYTWWLGTEGGKAIADVIFGDYNPSGKLPISFPRTEGQIPIYYNHFNTGRPPVSDNDYNGVSSYNDLPNSPMFPFGFGLSYSHFSYGEIKTNKKKLVGNTELLAEVKVTNQSNTKGKETIQLYIRDRVGSVVRPIKELKGFQLVEFKPHETKNLFFKITTEDLKFFNQDLKYDWEQGQFDIMLGTNSQEFKSVSVYWTK